MNRALLFSLICIFTVDTSACDALNGRTFFKGSLLTENRAPSYELNDRRVNNQFPGMIARRFSVVRKRPGRGAIEGSKWSLKKFFRLFIPGRE